MRLLVDAVRYGTVDAPFVGGLKPYQHQARTLSLVRGALAKGETICILNASATGSGKTLANFGPAILDGTPTLGIYPTNELIRDQEGALRERTAAHDVVRVDSATLDEWQDLMRVRGHTEALHSIVAAWQKRALLTNPDILYLMAYDLYGYSYKVGYRERIFQAIVNDYPVIAFDEFHLYDAKQVGNVAFIVGTVSRLAPKKPHVFIFSSATPRNVREWAERALGLRVEEVTDEPTSAGRVICEPVDGLTLVPANLSQWSGLETIKEIVWPEVEAYLNLAPAARGVFIVDSVYDAKALAAWLASRYGEEAVGEIHGYMDREARVGNLERRFTVGTTTIDVGIDLTGQKAKDFIVFEARSAAQFTQRLGRLGRRGREPGDIVIPNTAWALVPHYARNYVALRLKDMGEGLAPRWPRGVILSIVEEAYTPKEEFRRYWQMYSPLEAAAAEKRILAACLSDGHEEAQERLRRVICELYRGLGRDASAEEVRRLGKGIEGSQQKVWEQFGHLVERKGSNGKTYQDWYLDEIEAFRGGSDLQVALYDTLDERRGLFPFKVYSLPFVLRRTVFRESSRALFERLVRRKGGERAEAFLRQVDRARVLGYLQVDSLAECVGRFRFEAEERELFGRTGLLLKSDGWQIALDTPCSLNQINAVLARRFQVSWVVQMAPWDLGVQFNLPPMFHVYPMQPVGLNGRSTIGDRFWSVAFGLSAFLLDTHTKRTNDPILV